MANAFSKEEIVAFEDILEGFNDALILSKNVTIYNTNGVTMERARDTIWRPQPYIAQSFDRVVGTSIAGDVSTMTQLSVPSTLGFNKCSAWQMNALELRDALQEGRLGDSAKQKLASDINLSVMDLAAAQGTLVVPIATAAGTYDDVALCDSIMNEQGVMAGDRYLALSSRDYNGMAGNLAVATRSFTGNKSANAYERSFVGEVASFQTYKLDYANRCAANAATPTIATNGAQVRYVPQATTTSTGGVLNVGGTYALLEAESLVVSKDDDLVGTYTDIHGIQFYSGSNFIDITVNGLEFGDYVSGSLIAVSNNTGNPQAIVRFQNYSNWTDGTVSITAPLQAQTGSQVTGSLSISGSLKFATSSSFTFPTVQPASPVAGTAFFSGSRLYIYNGSAYVSASFS
jgi:hypothetical protein